MFTKQAKKAIEKGKVHATIRRDTALKAIQSASFSYAECAFHYTDDYAWDNANNFGKGTVSAETIIQDLGHGFTSSRCYISVDNPNCLTVRIHSNLVYHVYFKEESQSAQQPQQDAQSEVVASEEITVSLNEEKQGIEISFASKPSDSILSALRANGFRWHRFKKVWYAKQSEERLQFIQSLTPSQSEQVEEEQQTTVTETTEPEPQQTTSPYSHLIGSRVLGNWGMAGIDYGTIKDVHTDSYGTDIIIKWEDSEELDESREDLKGVSIINDSTDINVIGIYIDTVGTYLSHPKQSAEQEAEATQEPTPNNKPNNVISLADRRKQKQQQAEEKRQLEQAETFFLQEVLPYMTQEEKQQVLNIADDPKKFSSFMLEVALKCKIRQNE